MDIDIRRDPDESRYVLTVDGTLASALDYRERGDAIAFPHTVTVPSFRGQGLADRLVTFAIDDVRARGITHVTPSCWYVADWFARHPEHAELIAE